MKNLARSKPNRWIVKAIFVVGLSFVVGHTLYSHSLKEYERGRSLTLNEYVEAFDAYKAELVQSPGSLWPYVLTSLLIAAFLFAFYELFGLAVGWLVWRIHEVAAGKARVLGREEMYTTHGIPQQLDAEVRRELEPGEVIRWIEQPIPRYFTPKAKGFFLFGIPWTAFAIFWTFGAAGFKIPDFSEGMQGFEFFPLFGLPFILIGLGMLSTPLWAYRKALRTMYVITDRRAITFDGGRSMTIRSYPPPKLQDVYRKEKRDGTGDVIISIRAWRDSDGDRQSEELGFLRVRDAKNVERMLKELTEQKPAPRR
jgi:hypothetical protein